MGSQLEVSPVSSLPAPRHYNQTLPVAIPYPQYQHSPTGHFGMEKTLKAI